MKLFKIDGIGMVGEQIIMVDKITMIETIDSDEMENNGGAFVYLGSSEMHIEITKKQLSELMEIIWIN